MAIWSQNATRIGTGNRDAWIATGPMVTTGSGDYSTPHISALGVTNSESSMARFVVAVEEESMQAEVSEVSLAHLELRFWSALHL